MNYLTYFRCFGWSLTLKYLLAHKVGIAFRKGFDAAVINLVDSQVGYILNEGIEKKTVSQNRNVIWTMWWQGLEKMPESVRKCCASIEKNKPVGYEFVIVSKDNYKEYVDLPDNIISKFDNGIISITHFSDILRFYLLSEYGGLWIDATLYIQNGFRINNPETSFYTARMKQDSEIVSISKGRWMLGLWYAPVNDVYSKLIYLMLVEYWEKTDYLVDYFLTDYIIYELYVKCPEFRNQLDIMPRDGEYFFELEKHMNDCYIEEEYNRIMSLSAFHRVSWKKDYFEKNGGVPTVYYHWIHS